MSPRSPDLDHVVITSQGPPTEEAILALRRLLRTPERADAIRMLRARPGHSEPILSTARLMKYFESGMDAAPEVFGYLMALLHPFAFREKDAATCDGIELWMHGTRSPLLAEAPRDLATMVGPSRARRITAWAEHVGGTGDSRAP